MKNSFFCELFANGFFLSIFFAIALLIVFRHCHWACNLFMLWSIFFSDASTVRSVVPNFPPICFTLLESAQHAYSLSLYFYLCASLNCPTHRADSLNTIHYSEGSIQLSEKRFSHTFVHRNRESERRREKWSACVCNCNCVLSAPNFLVSIFSIRSVARTYACEVVFVPYK